MRFKCAIGKLEAPDDWMERAEAFGIQWLPVLPHHVRALRLLPPIHRNPFDRILVAQSKVENLRLIMTTLSCWSISVNSRGKAGNAPRSDWG